jgi:hypothetical protein
MGIAHWPMRAAKNAAMPPKAPNAPASKSATTAYEPERPRAAEDKVVRVLMQGHALSLPGLSARMPAR